MLLEVAERGVADDQSSNGLFSSNVPVHQYRVYWAEVKKECELCLVLWMKAKLTRLLKHKRLPGYSTFDLRVKRTSQGCQGEEPLVRLHISSEGGRNEKFAKEYELRVVARGKSGS